MPGNVQQALATLVMPQTLSTSFSSTRAVPLFMNYFHDGSNISGLITNGTDLPTSLKSWRQAKRLNAAALATLRTFFETLFGALTPFYFYDPNEAIGQIGSNYDATGTSTTGRHTCKFTTQVWSESTGLARTDVGALEFMEVA